MTDIEIAKLSPLLLLGHPQPVLVDDVNSTDRCAQELHGSTHLVRHQVCALVHVGSQVTTQFCYDRFADLVDDACEIKFTAPTTSHLNVVVQSPSLHWGGSKWLVNSPRVSSSGDSPLDNSSHFLSLLSNARSHVDSTLKPN